jgi:hypothetical protein
MIPVEEVSVAQPVQNEKPEVYDSRVLTMEEQRDIAMRVCFFFISVILGAFGLLYVYHRMKQSSEKVQKETL